MESFFLFLVKELSGKIGPVGGLLVALLVVLYYFERKAREKITDKAFELFTDVAKTMTEFNGTLEDIERHLNDLEHEVVSIKRDR
jgi:hypothetical protein